jgi:Zn-dependent metalloprotease
VSKRPRWARLGVLFAMLSLATVMSGAASGGATKSNGRGLDQELLRQLIAAAEGSVQVSREDATTMAAFIRAGQNGDLLDDNLSASSKAARFFDRYGALFGAGDESSLQKSSTFKDGDGGTHIRYEQFYKGVPVWGGELIAHLDGHLNLTAVNGTAVPNIAVNVKPRLSEARAVSRAIATVVADPPTDAQTGDKLKLSAVQLKGKAILYVYRLGLVKNERGSNQLVYEVEVTDGAGVRDFVFVHAHSGKIVNRYSAIHDALNRELYEARSVGNPPTVKFQLVWKEGDKFPGNLNSEQQNLVAFSGDTYRFFFNLVGRDSYDGNGAKMVTINNDPRINCPNANWNGITTNYCNGVTSDDVVVHEWGHAYTDFTHDLIYQWQPGALNEAYSDIWGETVDLINGAGTDSPAPVRTSGACSTRTVPVPVLIINTPTPGECPAGAAAFGPPLTAAGTTGDLVLANDGVGTTTDACEALPANSMTGKIGLIDRGTCTFTVKVKNAQNAGAIGAAIANINNGGPFGMAGGDATITIPSLGISQAHGNLLKGFLQTGASNVTLRVKSGQVPPQNSLRWLLAEDSFAFNPTAGAGNHAIRDMWEPTCLSDPGKVSDVEYHCDVSDGGGVHSNSGVPNHGYALLVDGGTYNGQSITGIGLTKAAHIYWRAQAVYQTRTSDFADHADALLASCNDLIGDPLTSLSTTTPGTFTGRISATDCGQIRKMIAAVELRRDPTAQCNFTPLLDPNAPDACGKGSRSQTIFSQNFDGSNPLSGWSVTNDPVFEGATIVDWRVRSDLPGGRRSTAVFAEDLDGQCDGSANDKSGVMTLTSPSIQITGGTGGHRLTFLHYVATEFSFDGGNVKISVNDGPFAVVPASAFTFNDYNTTLATTAQGNTNPLQGQPGFSGTDGGQVFGSWGESQIDLGKLGVEAGDSIELSFDFGMDGCGAVDGWYVDDIEILACEGGGAAATGKAVRERFTRS